MEADGEVESDLIGSTVQVYWNLRKKTWSIRSKKTRKVVGYSDHVILTGVKFVVSESGRQRVITEKRKNVHAWAEGTMLTNVSCTVLGHDFKQISYNPYKSGNFAYKSNGRPVRVAERVMFCPDAVAYIMKRIK